MSKDTYEGYPNRETWAVNLWLSNEYDVYIFAWEYIARMNPRKGSLIDTVTVAEWLESYCRNLVTPETTSLPESLRRNMREDIGSMWRVDWHYIADYWIEAMREEDNATNEKEATEGTQT